MSLHERIGVEMWVTSLPGETFQQYENRCLNLWERLIAVVPPDVPYTTVRESVAVKTPAPKPAFGEKNS
jgi:hypothetical protein